jgi:hypothetical protein
VALIAVCWQTPSAAAASAVSTARHQLRNRVITATQPGAGPSSFSVAQLFASSSQSTAAHSAHTDRSGTMPMPLYDNRDR